jgi:hypothetical protein
MATYKADPEDLRAWASFNAQTQAALKAGKTITAGDGRRFALVNGHATAVGSDSYTRGMAAREENGESSAVEQQEPSTPSDPRPPVAPPVVSTGAGDTGGGASTLPPDILAGGTDPATQAAKLAKDASNRDALASINDVLSQYGLQSLSGFAWQEIVSGRSGNEVLQDLRETPQFQQRFPAIAARQKAGLPPLSPGDYVSYENTATQYMRDAGLPPGFYDSPEDFTKFLANDVSLKELASRVDLAKQAAYQAPPEVRTALRGQFGLGDGDLAAYFLDPNRAQPLLQRTYNAAQIAGAGTRTGYDVNPEQDYRLADQGVSAAQAQAGFSTLQQSQELYNPLAGHANEGAITTDQQLGAAFGGNAADQLSVERRRQQRQADFQDGGAFASSQQGISGLGVAQPR